MRKSYHSLSGIVTNIMDCDPRNGDVYIFINKNLNRIKLLHWELGGMVIYSKLLEADTLGRGPDIGGDDLFGIIECRYKGIIEKEDSRRQRLESLKKLRE